jgi:hypothetical protein
MKELEVINSTNQQVVVSLDEQIKQLETERSELKELVDRHQNELDSKSGFEEEKETLRGTIRELEMTLKDQVEQSTSEILALKEKFEGLEQERGHKEKG